MWSNFSWRSSLTRRREGNILLAKFSKTHAVLVVLVVVVVVEYNNQYSALVSFHQLCPWFINACLAVVLWNNYSRWGKWGATCPSASPATFVITAVSSWQDLPVSWSQTSSCTHWQTCSHDWGITKRTCTVIGCDRDPIVRVRALGLSVCQTKRTHARAHARTPQGQHCCSYELCDIALRTLVLLECVLAEWACVCACASCLTFSVCFNKTHEGTVSKHAGSGSLCMDALPLSHIFILSLRQPDRK